MEYPLISIIVTTKNEEKNIDNCLKAILEQTYPKDKIEIIVVDNNSGDKTKSIAKKYTKNVFNAGPERSAQRNYGVNRSKGTWILYLDADMSLSPNVLSDCVARLFGDKEIIALYIGEVVVGDSYFARVRRFERFFYDGTVIDCVRFVKKSAFEKVGGFDTTLTGPEDWDFDKKIRSVGKVVLVKTPLYHNEGSFNLKKYLSKKAYYAKSFDTYIQKWGKQDPDIRKQFGFVYRYFEVFTENDKWKILIRYTYLLVGLLFLRFLVGIYFIMRKHPLQGVLRERQELRVVELPVISIIIATKNEETNIERCLKSVLSQDYPKNRIEIVVVDNNSSDKTKKFARNYTGNVFDLSKEIFADNIRNYRGAQLNFGVEKVSGTVIFFPDADMTFQGDLFREVVSRLNIYDALYVPEEICGRGFFGKVRNFERGFYDGTVVDAVRFVKAKAFLKVGGFDTNNILFGPDDWDFTKSLKSQNFNIGIVASSKLFHHEEGLNLRAYLKKKDRYSQTFDGYVQKWGKDDPDIKKQLGFYYRIIGVFIEEGKWKRLFLYPVLTCGMIFVRFLVGVRFIKSLFISKIRAL